MALETLDFEVSLSSKENDLGTHFNLIIASKSGMGNFDDKEGHIFSLPPSEDHMTTDLTATRRI